MAIMTSCEAALESTQGLLLEYTSLSSTERETWERSEHTLDQVATLKENLAQSVRRLTLFNTTQNRYVTDESFSEHSKNCRFMLLEPSTCLLDFLAIQKQEPIFFMHLPSTASLWVSDLQRSYFHHD